MNVGSLAIIKTVSEIHKRVESNKRNDKSFPEKQKHIMMDVIAIVLFSIVLILSYFCGIKPFNYWSIKNVKTGKIVPFFGNCLDMVLRRKAFYEMIIGIYNTYPEKRYVGAYLFSVPLLVLKSPKLIKQICVKDFDHFQNHRSLIPDGIDELWTKTIFSLKGETWRNMRSTLSPIFTSSKIKTMCMMINSNAKLFSEYFLKENEDVIEVEFKDAFGRYTIDVLASVVFGIQANSLYDRENDFYVMGGSASSLNTLYTRTVFFLYLVLPKITSIFRFPSVTQKGRIFFIETIKNLIKMREELNIRSLDILGILMNLKQRQSFNNDEIGFAPVDEDCENKRKTNLELTDDDILSQIFNFFLGGFETVSNGICFIAYELAVNPDVQQKLIQEVEDNRPETGNPSYETIVKMTYMDMVISEALRKWPLVVTVDRVVTKPYTIQPESSDEDPVELDIDDIVAIPIIAIHRDPQYYPDPMRFDPERFCPENKTLIDSYTYLPFGVGPRDCIGKRFALLEIKAIFFQILLHFEIVPVAKTEIPLECSKTALNIVPENGLTLGLKRRL